MMSDLFILQMQEPYRQQLITKHKFYVEQAKKRLLSQFEDISGEMDKHMNEWNSNANAGFNPDCHDPDDFLLVPAENEACIFNELLTDMHEQTQLSVVAGMYHTWDKELRKWIAICLDRSFLVDNSNAKAVIWTATFDNIIDLLASSGWQVRDKHYFKQLDICRLVVNVYKHGIGHSFDKLKEDYPQFMKEVLGRLWDVNIIGYYLYYPHLKVTDSHIFEFSNAITAFWDDVPRNDIQLSLSNTSNKWLSKAREVDLR
ncbi:hypothetical protein [Nitrospira sp. M1]